MWNAFAGYLDIYGEPPPARKVRRVTLYLQEQNRYEYEQSLEQQRKLEDAERERDRNARISARGR